jgi:hypothetical protein
VPDPRSKNFPGRFPNQPLINPNCFGALSELLWDLGFRHHEDLQTKWVKPLSGPASNFSVWDITDVKPHAAEMLVDQFPEVAKKLEKVTPENHQEALREQSAALKESLKRLESAQERMGKDSD